MTTEEGGHTSHLKLSCDPPWAPRPSQGPYADADSSLVGVQTQRRAMCLSKNFHEDSFCRSRNLKELQSRESQQNFKDFKSFNGCSQSFE